MQANRTPGVYRQELFPSPPTTVATGIPAFLGFARKQIKFWFKLDLAFADELDQGGHPSSNLRDEFEANRIPLSRAQPIVVVEKEQQWLVADKNQVWYQINKEQDGLEVVDTTAPANTPQMLTLWSHFGEQFGQSLPQGYLAQAVRGFFENQGQLCYVVRLDDQLPADEALKQGLLALAPVDEVDLICAPDIVRSNQAAPDQDTVISMQDAVLAHCDRSTDRFAILDPLPGRSVETIQDQRQKLTGDNGALYYPWLGIEAGGGQGGVTYVPPCGHIAGVYARTDRRAGVHQAPANEILAGALDLEINLDNAQQDELNPNDINCLRAFPGRGIRIWGARTLSNDPAWTYVNVRRLFLTVRRWIERGLAGLVLEPNDPNLWARLERELTIYLNGLFRSGALKGRTAQEAFYVRCNAETNPPEVREAGQVVAEIGLAPAGPSEFIVVRLIQDIGGATIIGPMRPV